MLILECNKKIRNIIIKINKLEKWEDFILFEGNKYGIRKVLDNIHRENDCCGKIIIISKVYTECVSVNGVCGHQCGQYIITYKCSKCNYTFVK